VSRKQPTTPATAAAQKAGITFRVLEYELDARAESFGLEVAEKLDLPTERVFKTLIVDADGQHLFALVPVQARLDTRALGQRVALADPDDDCSRSTPTGAARTSASCGTAARFRRASR
jgi:Cys-tRNA(Pro)/Cys-tRNA(Cys) deacylase